MAGTPSASRAVAPTGFWAEHSGAISIPGGAGDADVPLDAFYSLVTFDVLTGPPAASGLTWAAGSPHLLTAAVDGIWQVQAHVYLGTDVTAKSAAYYQAQDFDGVVGFTRFDQPVTGGVARTLYPQGTLSLQVTKHFNLEVGCEAAFTDPFVITTYVALLIIRLA